MRVTLWMTMTVTAVTAAVGLAACGTSPDAAVREKVNQFARATQHHDYHTICTQVLAPSLISRLDAVGGGCERAMALGLGSFITRPCRSARSR